MIPVLHPADSTSWGSFGLGALSDAVSCEVTEERNGQYELEMMYPVSGQHYSDLELRAIILAKPNFNDNPQPFRIYNISKPLNGIVTVNAQHLCYDLSGYVDGACCRHADGHQTDIDQGADGRDFRFSDRSLAW